MTIKAASISQRGGQMPETGPAGFAEQPQAPESPRPKKNELKMKRLDIGPIFCLVFGFFLP